MSIDELPEVVHGYPRHWVNWIMNLGSARTVDDAIALIQLIRAIDLKDTAIVKELLSRGIDPNVKLPNRPMLELAVCSAEPQIVKAMLDSGADPNTPGAVSSAIMYGQHEILKMLLKAGARIKPGQFVCACTDGKAAAVRLLLDHGADVNDVRDYALSPGIEIRNVTALMAAAADSGPAVVKMLLAADADVHRRDSDGRTALDWARSRKTAQARRNMELLEQAGAPAGAGELERVDPPDFARDAKSPQFLDAISRVQAAAGVKPVRIELEETSIKGGAAFVVAEAKARQIVEALRDECRKLGSTIFVSRDIARRSGWCVGLLPTTDIYQVIAAIGTAGDDKAASTASLIRWLKEVGLTHSLEITDVGTDFLRGRFTSAVSDGQRLAARIYELCPDIVNQGIGTVEALADGLKGSRSLYLWWD